VILFCIDCSESMQELRDDPVYEGVQTSHLLEALDAAMKIQKRKVIVGPMDSVGILLFNVVRERTLAKLIFQFSRQVRAHDQPEVGPEMKPNTFLLQPIETINAPRIKEIIHILEGSLPLPYTATGPKTITDARSDSEYLRTQFPPSKEQAPLGDVFTCCNWAIRDG